MNSTTQSSGYGSGPNAIDNRTLLMTLAASTVLAFAFTLLLYVALSGRNPLPRVPFGFLVSVLPAFGAFMVLKLTNVFVSRRGAVFIYFALFVLFVFIQAFGRLISV